MSFLKNINWLVLLDQLHNLLIASAGSITALGFGTANNLLGYGGLALAVVASIVSGFNVSAATAVTPGAANVTPKPAAAS